MILDLLKELKELGDPNAFRDKDYKKLINFEVGSNLRNEISLSGMKIQDAAALLDMTPGNLDKIFNGEVGIDTPKYFALMVLLGYNPQNIMLGRNSLIYLSEFTGIEFSRYMIMDYVISELDKMIIEVNKLDDENSFEMYRIMLLKLIEAQRKRR